MEVNDYEDLSVIRAEGEIDHWRATELEQKIDDAIRGSENDVIVDFSDLTYIDSGGISVLFVQLKKLIEKERRMIVVTENKNIIKILRLVNIINQKNFELKPNLKQAKRIIN